jgi:hypothetical protein
MAAALPAPIGKWSLTSLQQRLVKTGGFNQARTLLLAVAGAEPSDAAAFREHAAENCDAAVASRIGGLQSTANFGDG